MLLTYRGLKDIPMANYTGPKLRVTSNEFRCMALAGRLFIACQDKLGKAMKQRLNCHPGAWRNWQSGVALLGRALDVIYQSVPDDQFKRLADTLEQGIIRIDLPLASERRNGVVAVEGDALKELCECVMTAECAICIKEGGQVRGCRVYKALKGCYDPDTWESRGCPYRDQALRSMEE